MAKAKYTGVTPTDEGGWQYRIKIKTEDGKIVDTKIKKDLDGLPFLTARAAHEAREAHRVRILNNQQEKPKEAKRTLLKDIYKHYQQTEGKTKASATIRKQESMWNNYIKDELGERDINSITIVDLNTFLETLYQTHAYSYVEGFLRFFYLLFGHADRMEVIEQNRYYRMFANKNTRLSMPAKNQLDHEEDLKGVAVFSDLDLEIMTRIFNHDECNVKLAYYLGLYCGLRISETFALRWSCVDFDNHTIRIDRQEHYIDNTIRLCPVKTLKGVRTVPVPPTAWEILEDTYHEQYINKRVMGNSYKDTERVYDELEKKWITGGDFVNRKHDGEILTVNSMKYWSKKIKAETGIDFKYHTLRHTYATRLALKNCPLTILMELMGHKKIDTTKKYYLNADDPTARNYTSNLIESMYNLQGNLIIKVIKDEEKED